jgi:flagellar assembly protein FliH
VDAEEKKSLPNSEVRTSQSRQTGFRLHCFPDIPFDNAENHRRGSQAAKIFQRNQSKNTELDCTNLAPGLVEDETAYHNRKLSSAEHNENLYQRGFTDGKKQGVIEGESKGFEQGKKLVQPLIKDFQEALMRFKNLRKETYHNLEKEVVELALAIAKQVICREVRVDREIVVCVARQALAKVDNPGKIKIKLSTADLQFIDENKHLWPDLISDIDNVTFVAEENIQSGGCIIETDLGGIDARIDRQLQAVEDSFRAAVAKSSGDG